MQRTERDKMYLYLLCLPIALLPVASLAHNGAVAIAIPVESIAIDGDRSDGPRLERV